MVAVSDSGGFVDPEPLLREQLEEGLEELDELLRDAPTDEERGRIRQARHLLLVNYRKAPWYANWLTSSPLADDDDPPGRSDA